MTSQDGRTTMTLLETQLRRWTKDVLLDTVVTSTTYNIYKDSSHAVTRLDSVKTKLKALSSKVAGSNPARSVEFSSGIVIIFKDDNFYNNDAIASAIGLKERPFKYLTTCLRKDGFDKWKIGGAAFKI